MESARSYRRPPLDDAGLARARERAKHVIVLMLENRSFDHMFGLLDHPKEEFTNIAVGEFPNPYDLTDPTRAATVTANGEPRLERDPPHGHVAAMTQLNLRGNTFQMDGFVAAYAQKIAGKEHVPKPRWGRLGVLAVFLALPIAAAVHDAARRGVNGGWAGLQYWVAGAAVVVALAILLLELKDLPGIRRRYLVAAGAGAALFGAFAGAGIDRWFSGEPRGRVTWSLVAVALLMLVLWFVRAKLSKELEVPDDDVRRMSEQIMRCMPPSRIPALAQLARTYAVCTRWHSSVPGATWPNRNFVHSATSDESVDIELGFYGDRTIFEALDDEETEPRPTWRIYHHDTPQVFAFDSLWTESRRRRRWFDAGRLLDDIRDGTLPTYSFVEPCHTGRKANSQHPGNNEAFAAGDFVRGEKLIASIYNALVANPELFKETVFVVTYDEHGGFFDHVPPPRAVHPERRGHRRRSREVGRRIVSKFIEYDNRPFPFTHLGVRVPTVVVSPWVADHKVDATVYDHASVVASIRRLWAPSAEPLSQRDRYANDFLHLLVEREPDEPMDDVQPVTAYDPVAMEADVGTATADIELDPAAQGRATEEVFLKDDFSAQLGQLNHLVRSEIHTSPGDDVLVTATPSERVPTAALFKASASSTRAGNPSVDDL